MSGVPCASCGQLVYSNEQQCPNCGRQFSERRTAAINRGQAIFLAVFCAVLVVGLAASIWWFILRSEPSRYGAEVRTNFLNSCEVFTHDVTSCRCALNKLEERFTESEFLLFERQALELNQDFPQSMKDAVAECKPAG